MTKPLPPPSPERDRAVAARPRLTPRYAEGIDDLVKSFLGSEEAKRLRRFARVRGALDRTLGAQAAKVKATGLRDGVLTLEVADSVLLGELRNHHSHGLLRALAEDRTGVTRVAWRLAKRPERAAGRIVRDP